MSLTVNIGEAKARLSDLIAKVEGGEDVNYRARSAAGRASDAASPTIWTSRRPIKEIKAARANRPKTTVDEILAWRDEGRRV